MGRFSIYPHQVRHAADVLARVLAQPGPADATLNAYFRENRQLGAKDRAFIADTLFRVLRRKRFLDWLVPDATPRQEILAGLIRLGGYGPDELQRVLQENEPAWLQEIAARPDAPLPLDVEADLPDWVVERLRGTLSENEIRTLGRGMQEAGPLDLRVNTLRATREEVLQALAQAGMPGTPTPYSPVGIRMAEKVPLRRHALSEEGKIEVQDEGSQILAYLVAPEPGEAVVDFCAGAGGKTLHLGALMKSKGRLYAFDVSEWRLRNLTPRLRRSGLSNVHAKVIRDENDAWVKRHQQQMDRVLVDAPCSRLGTLRRNPDLKLRHTPDAVRELAARQAAILQAASRLVRRGGRLVYATCSILPEENEDVVRSFLERNEDFAAANCAEILAAAGIGLDTGPFLRLHPAAHGTDAFFAAVLTRGQTAEPYAAPEDVGSAGSV